MTEYRFFLRGKIDFATIDRVGASLNLAASLHPGDVIVDCTNLEFIDCAGFGFRAALATKSAGVRRTRRVTHPTRTLRRMFKIFGAYGMVVESASSAASGEPLSQLFPLSLPVAQLAPLHAVRERFALSARFGGVLDRGMER